MGNSPEKRNAVLACGRPTCIPKMSIPDDTRLPFGPSGTTSIRIQTFAAYVMHIPYPRYIPVRVLCTPLSMRYASTEKYEVCLYRKGLAFVSFRQLGRIVPSSGSKKTAGYV